MIKNFDYLKDLHKKIWSGEDFVSWEINQTGGRQSGKTWSNEEFVLACLMIPNRRIRIECFRYMKGDKDEMLGGINDAAIRTNCSLFLAKPTKYYFQYKNNFLRVDGITTKNQKNIKKLGRHNPYCDYLILWIDEFYEWDNKDYLDLRQSIRNCKNIIIIRSSNPWMLQHFWVKYINNALPEDIDQLEQNGEQLLIDNDNNKIWHRTNWRINRHNLPEHIIQHFNELRVNDWQRAKVEDLGLAGAASGAIYASYLPKIKRDIPDMLSNFVGGLDYGFKKDSMAMVLLGATPKFDYVGAIGLYYWNNKLQYFKDHEQLAKEIIKKVVDKAFNYPIMFHGYVVYCDNSENAFIEILNRQARVQNCYWLSFRPCTKLKIVNRVHKNIGLMSEGRIFLPETKEYAEFWYEWQNMAWDENKLEPQPIDRDNHISDAWDYAITAWWNNLKPRNYIYN